MVLAFDPQRTFVEIADPDAQGYGQLTISMLEPGRQVPLLRYQTGDVARFLDPHAVAATLARHGLVAGDLPRALLALRGRTREQLPNGAHVALYKDALYANLELARQLTGAMRLVFASDGFTMHVQLVRGLDTVPGFERSLLNELAADARPSRVVAWPYARFPFGMGLDYERKFAYFVPGDPHR